MKKLLILISLFSLFGCSNQDKDRDLNEVAKQENYYFSENETACAFIFYDVEGAPPLTIEDRIINYHFDERNIITTSSSSDFGWRSEETSGARQTNYYKQDGSKMEHEEVINSANGDYEFEGVEYDYQVFHFTNQEGCLTPDDSSEDDNALFRELIKEIYKKNN